MSRARAVLVVRRFARMNGHERTELARWLRGQAEYLMRAVEFAPTLTLRLFDRDAPPAGDVFNGPEWNGGAAHHGRRKGSISHCSICGDSGHDRRRCPEA